MAFQQRDNSGALFVNDKKEGNQPDFKGDMLIDGKAYWLSAWQKPCKNNGTFLSIALKPKYDETKAPPPEDQSRPEACEDENLPF